MEVALITAVVAVMNPKKVSDTGNLPCITLVQYYNAELMNTFYFP